MSRPRYRWCRGVLVLLFVGGQLATPKVEAASGDPWARRLGGTDEDVGLGIALDSDGNVYTTGYFSGTADFNPDPGTAYDLTAVGTHEAFVSKLDAGGDFVWAVQLGGAEGYAIALEDLGNVYVTGFFEGTADFDPDVLIINNMTSAGNSDVFVSKLDADGTLVWAKGMGGTDDDLATSIAIDSLGNAYFTGYFERTADFDPGVGTHNLTTPGNSDVKDVFVSKLDSAGGFVWAERIGSTSAEAGNGIGLDADANVYITGYFEGTVDFDPDLVDTFPLSSGNANDNDVFVLKLDSDRGFIWARDWGATTFGEGDIASGLAVDSDGSVYTTGFFQETTDFDPGVGTTNLTSAGNSDVFVSKLDEDGDFVWAKRLGASGYDAGSRLTVDADGNVYTTGYFEGAVDFDPGIATSNLPSAFGNKDAFVSKLDAAGNFVSARRLGGPGLDFGTDVAVDPDANIYSIGYFLGTTDFDPGAGNSNLTSAGGNDVVIAKTAASYAVPMYVSVVPGRFMDTRVPASPTVDGMFQAIGTRFAGTTTELQITGRYGVPADAQAIVLNVTVTGAVGGGFVTVYPCGAALPNASNLNFVAGDTIPNLVITKIGAGGRVCLYTSANTHLIADVNGYYPAGSSSYAYPAGASYASVVPGRFMDTRVPASPTIDGLFQAIDIRTAGSTTELQITGRGGVVPADAQAVVLNVTATSAQANGFVTVYPCGESLPNASNLNYFAGDTIPNLVITKIGAGGKVCLYTFASTHLIADVNGYYPAASAYVPLVPGRLMDTRPSAITCDGGGPGTGIRTAGSTTQLLVTQRCGVPANAATVVLNVTVTGALGGGFVTVYPCDAALPNASNLNFVAADTIANLVVTKVGAGGNVCLYTSADTHVLADVSGYYPVPQGAP